MTFRIIALPAEPFAPLFAMPPDELATRLAVRETANSNPGFPCRVSLQDAEIGEPLILVNHVHMPTASPFRAAHAIYVRRGAAQAHPAAGKVPKLLRSRMLSLRAFDANGMIIGGDLVDGQDLEPALETLLGNVRTANVHIHFAKFGCYAAQAERA